MAPTPLTASVAVSHMQLFEDEINKDNVESSSKLYADECFVTVNGGVEKGGPFTGKTQQEVNAFLEQLRNGMGATNMKFTITKVYGNIHEDLWICDSGAGACVATWEQQGSTWKIIKDEITFWPNSDDGHRAEEYTKRCAELDAKKDYVPVSVVCQTMKEFEVAYNLDDTKTAADSYRSECLVTVNGGVEKGGPFTGKTPSEVHGFLNQLRNSMGATNCFWTITKVYDNVHEDTWTCDTGTGTCLATWEKQADGSWKIVSDEINFVPYATGEKKFDDNVHEDTWTCDCGSDFGKSIVEKFFDVLGHKNPP